MLRLIARKSRIIYPMTQILTSTKCSRAMDLAIRYGPMRARIVMLSPVRRCKSKTSTKFYTLILGPRSKATRRVTETKPRIWFHHKSWASTTSKRGSNSLIEEKQLTAKREILSEILTALDSWRRRPRCQLEPWWVKVILRVVESLRRVRRVIKDLGKALHRHWACRRRDLSENKWRLT